MSEMPSMGLAVGPVVFNSVHRVFDLGKDNQNYVSFRKYNRRKIGEILHSINAPISLTAT